MRLKLTHKFFLAILIYSLLIVGLMIGTVQFFAYRNFSDYVNRVELDQLDGLVQSLSALYQQEGGWDSLRADPQAFKEILRLSFPDQQSTRQQRRPPPRDRQRREEQARQDNRREFRRPPREDRRPPPLDREYREDDARRDQRPPRREEERREPGARPENPGQAPSGLSRRLSLFDEEKGLVFGNPHLSEQVLRAIEQDGTAIGWLGIRKRENLAHPLDREFLKQQTKAFYVIGVAVLFLGSLLALLLSGLLVRPIRGLMHAAKKLASFEFETRINTTRKDELGQLAQTFNALARKLKEYETARRQWLSDVAHELRTPLSVLQMEIESMQDGVKEVDEKALESLWAEVLHLGRIVQDLHDLSLAESKVLQMKKTRICAVRVLRETMSRYSERLNQEHLELMDELGQGDASEVLADKDRLIQLFANLIENALRYADRPGVLKIGGKALKKRLVLCFDDSGPGVPPEAMGRLFERFYRVDSSRNRDKGGSGLGLAICKNIVKAHGGTITAMKSPLGGLRVEITFPNA